MDRERYLPEITGISNSSTSPLRHRARPGLRQGRADIACGEGYGSELLATVARKVTGVDISEETIAHAARKYARPNIAFAVGSCACIPLADASVDLVVGFETIEHHDRHLEMMQEIRRVLRPAGALIISSPTSTIIGRATRQERIPCQGVLPSEFKDLLATGFRHVRVLGQRVNFGSLVAPTDGRATRFATYSRRDESVRREPGVETHLYIALASNAALPQVHGGLYDGTSYLAHNSRVATGRSPALRRRWPTAMGGSRALTKRWPSAMGGYCQP